MAGAMRTNSWAIAVTSENEIVGDLTFTVSSMAGSKLWGKWSKSMSIARSGPYKGRHASVNRFF